MKTLNEILRDLREDHDMKQETVAKYLCVSQQAYSNYENGHREIPVTVVKALAKLYKVSTDYLLRFDSGYIGNLDLNAVYVDGITMRDIILNMQALKDNKRKDLVKYIQFLGRDEGQRDGRG